MRYENMVKEKEISIIVPCRNEEKYIEKCLKSILKFDKLNELSNEIIFIDGMSTDRTKEILLDYSVQFANIRILNNPKLIQAAALNIGIASASGKYILRLDAHSEYPSDYLLKLIKTARRTNADNVGGIVITKPGNKTYNAYLVQALTTHKFGVGDSGFRTGAGEGETDTVPYGFFKREVFEKYGGFNEQLVRAQDYEFNRRIIINGGKIWRNPDIRISYFNQATLWGFLRKQFFKEAPYNVYMWYLAPYTFTYRHAITGAFALGIIAGFVLSFFSVVLKWIYIAVLILYFLLAVISSIQQAIRYRKIAHIFVLPISFFLFHFIHGIGLIKGAIKLMFGVSPVQIKHKKSQNG